MLYFVSCYSSKWKYANFLFLPTLTKKETFASSLWSSLSRLVWVRFLLKDAIVPLDGVVVSLKLDWLVKDVSSLFCELQNGLHHFLFSSFSFFSSFSLSFKLLFWLNQATPTATPTAPPNSLTFVLVFTLAFALVFVFVFTFAFAFLFCIFDFYVFWLFPKLGHSFTLAEIIFFFKSAFFGRRLFFFD